MLKCNILNAKRLLSQIVLLAHNANEKAHLHQDNLFRPFMVSLGSRALETDNKIRPRPTGVPYVYADQQLISPRKV